VGHMYTLQLQQFRVCVCWTDTQCDSCSKQLQAASGPATPVLHCSTEQEPGVECDGRVVSRLMLLSQSPLHMYVGGPGSAEQLLTCSLVIGALYCQY